MELLITVAIVGILAAVAFPAYQGYTQKARRTDAKDALTQLAARQEQFYAKCMRYAATVAGNYGLDCGDSGIGLGLAGKSPEGHYDISISASATTTYTARASVASGSPQSSDEAKCQALTINNFGQKTDVSCW